MHTTRRTALASLAALTAAPVSSAWAQPAPWPAKTVRIVVAFTAGGTTDILARTLSEKLGERFKQPFIIDNKPGAAGNLGTEIVVRAPPDGYTLIINSTGPIAVDPTLFPKLSYNPITDLIPVVLIADVPNVLVVHPSLPVKTFDEFVAYAKKTPGMNYCSTGVGTASHLAGFLFSKRAGLDTTHVPYKGADALRDLIAGRIHFMFATIPSVKGQIDAGTLRAIAVSSDRRSRSMPDIPTVAERGFPGFAASSWFGMFAPKNTSPEIVNQLNKAVNEIMGVSAVEAQMIKEGADPVGGTPQSFAQFVQREFERWRAVVKESGATAE